MADLADPFVNVIQNSIQYVLQDGTRSSVP